MSLRATGKKVLIEPATEAERTKGGIMLAPSYRQPENQGFVRSIGGKVSRMNFPDLRIGAQVTYSWIDSVEINYEGRTFRVVDVDRLLAVIE